MQINREPWERATTIKNLINEAYLFVRLQQPRTYGSINKSHLRALRRWLEIQNQQPINDLQEHNKSKEPLRFFLKSQIHRSFSISNQKKTYT